MAGKVLWVDMPKDKEGRCRGFAVVEYDHPVESVQAISMLHNQQLFDRPMTVRMDRIPEREKLPEGLKSIGVGLGLNGEPLKDVAHNLPTASNAQPAVTGGGILGAVPNLMSINTNANSLGNLTNVASALGNLNTSAAMLQAANLANLPNNLLGGGGDLSLAANLVAANNPFAQANLASSNLNSTGSGFNRGSSDGFMGSGGGSSGALAQGTGGYQGGSTGGRNFQSTYDTSKGGGNFSFGGGDNRSNSYGGQTAVQSSSGKYNNKIVITNVS